MSMAGIATCMSLAHTLLLLLGAAPALWRHRCLHGIPSPMGHIVQWSVANGEEGGLTSAFTQAVLLVPWCPDV